MTLLLYIIATPVALIAILLTVAAAYLSATRFLNPDEFKRIQEISRKLGDPSPGPHEIVDRYQDEHYPTLEEVAREIREHKQGRA